MLSGGFRSKGRVRGAHREPRLDSPSLPPICSSEDRYFVPIIVLRFAASSESPVQFVKLVEPTGAVVQMVPSL